MPSASPTTSPLPPAAVIGLRPEVAPVFLWPTLDRTYPKAGPVGMLVVALAYFSLGVAVGALLKHSPRGRRWLPVLVVPGILAGLAFFVWVIRSLR